MLSKYKQTLNRELGRIQLEDTVKNRQLIHGILQMKINKHHWGTRTYLMGLFLREYCLEYKNSILRKGV